MQFSDVVQNRQSIRKYLPRLVEEHKLKAILEVVRRAPSAWNFQAFEIFVATTPEKIRALTDATFDQKFIAQAPLALIFCVDSARCQYQPAEYFAQQDTAIATTFAMLAITDLGLATCWIGAFIPEKVAAAMQIPAGLRPLAILPIGYPDEVPERTTRRDLSEFVREL
jgi:nitroreductase